MKEIVAGGELGRIRHIEARFCVPMFRKGDIRYSHELAGGSVMDLGCYAINLLRFLAGAEPEVTGTSVRLSSPQLDRFMKADLRFPDRSSGRIVSSLLSHHLLAINARVIGESGELRVLNPFMPHVYHRLKVSTATGSRTERFPGETTYTCQLRAFDSAVRGESAVSTGADDAVLNMRVIDAIYTHAGLKPRGR